MKFGGFIADGVRHPLCLVVLVVCVEVVGGWLIDFVIVIVIVVVVFVVVVVVVVIVIER